MGQACTMTGMGNRKETPEKRGQGTGWASYALGYRQLVGAGSRLASRRDFILVAAAIVYFLGYLVWALNAWIQGLGILPAADLQYFVAGLMPATTLMVAWIVGRPLLEWFRFQLEGTYLFQQFGYWIVSNAWLAFGIFLLATDENKQTGIFVIGTGVFVSWLWLPEIRLYTSEKLDVFAGREKRHLPQRVATKLVRWLDAVEPIVSGMRFASIIGIGLTYLAAILWFFVLFGYPQVPQEFGGLKPRCAYLELDTALVSEDTLNEFLTRGNECTETGSRTFGGSRDIVQQGRFVIDSG